MNLSSYFPKFILLLITLSLITGCSFFNNDNSAMPAEVVVDKTLLKGRVLNQKLFQQHESLVLNRIKAGPGVIANQQIDRLSNHFVQAVIDYTESVNIIFAEDANDAKMLVKGYFVEKKSDGFVKFWGKQDILAIELKIYDLKTEQVIVFYTDSQNIQKSKNSFERLAAQLGKEFAEYLNKARAK